VSVKGPIVLGSPAARSAPAHAGVATIFNADVVIISVLALLALASWLPRMQGPIDFRWDGATYYILGTALAEGKGYRLLNEPGEIEAVQYPPLLPAIIALHQLALGTNDPVIVGRYLRLSFFLMYLAFIFYSYVLVRQFLPPLYAFGAALTVLLNVFTNFLSDLCFAEIPFGLTITLFVLVNRKPGRLYAVLAGALAIAAYLLRTIGLAVLAAWTCEPLFFGQYRKAAVRALFSVVPVLAWHGYLYSVESSLSYTHPAYAYQRAEYMFYNVTYSRNVSLRDPFAPELGKLSLEELAGRFIENLAKMPVSLGETVSAKFDYCRIHIRRIIQPIQAFPGVWRLVYAAYPVLFLLGVLIVTGMILLIRDGEVLIPVCALFVLAALCLIPWPVQWQRYWAPVVPLLALALFRAFLAVNHWFRSDSWSVKTLRGSVAALLSLAVLLQVLTLYMAYVEEMGRWEYRDEDGHIVTSRLFYYQKLGYRELDVGLDWLMTQARSGDIVAASMPHYVYVRTGLKSVMPPFERNLNRMQDLLDSVPVTYVVVDASPINFTRDYTLPLLKTFPQQWSLVHTVPGVTEDGQRGMLEIYRRLGR